MNDFKHILSVLATSFVETLWPTRCACCNLPGVLLCQDCRKKLPYIDAALACQRCGAPYGSLNCTECGIDEAETSPEERQAEYPFAQARAALSYNELARRIITAYKDEGERALATEIAHFIARAICADTPREDNAPPAFRKDAKSWVAWADVLTAIPATPDALRRRGYDHMDEVARLCARELDLPYRPLLRCSRRVADQRQLNREMRALNRAQSFSLAEQAGCVPERIVLIDDVLTTGATTSDATLALLQAGAKEVRVAVFARVW